MADPLRIRSITPALVTPAGGAVLVVVADGLGDAEGTVMVGGVAATVRSWSASGRQVTVTAPPLPAGTHAIAVTNADDSADTYPAAVICRTPDAALSVMQQLEEAIIQRLRDAGLQASSFAVSDLDDDDRLRLVKLPAVNAAVTSVELTPATSGDMSKRYTMRLTVTLSVAVRNLGGEARQRAAAYALLSGILYSLMEKRLSHGTPAADIGVKPLAPSGMRLAYYSTTVEVWQFVFRTQTNAIPVDDETAAALTTIGMDYYLQEPADTTVDAQDIVQLEQT